MSPLVSVGLPVYNGERYLAETLDSILAQEFGDFEIIISDNASTDGTRDICEAYARIDERITYSRLPENLGAAANYNRVFRMSQGNLFKWAAHDDLLRPTFLARCVEPFRSGKTTPAIVYPHAEFIDENSESIGPDLDRMQATSSYSFIRAFQALQGMNMVASVFGVFHRETLEKTRLIGSFAASDYVLLLEVSILGRIIQLEGEPLFRRRIHPGMSRKANLSTEEVLQWFDPKARLNQRFYVEYVRSAIQLNDLGSTERIACVLAILSGVGLRRTRVILGRHRRNLFSRRSKGVA